MSHTRSIRNVRSSFLNSHPVLTLRLVLVTGEIDAVLVHET